jgi:CRISPR-associated protein Cst2
MNTFVKPNGAHRNTQSPHIVDFQGAVTTSTSSLPAPTVSALNNDYEEEINRVAAVLNGIHLNGIKVHSFRGLAGFTEAIATVLGPSMARTHA